MGAKPRPVCFPADYRGLSPVNLSGSAFGVTVNVTGSARARYQSELHKS